MHIRRWVLTPLAFAILASAAVSYAPALAQQKKDQKLDKIQQQELQAAYKMADAAAAGQQVPTDIGMSMRTDFLKAQNGLTFVPFVLSLDPAQVSAKTVTLYLRLVARTPAGAAAPVAGAAVAVAVAGAAKSEAAPAKNPQDAAAKAPDYAFQGVHFVELKAPPAGEPYRLSRAFSVTAGDYDLYIVVRERAATEAKSKAAGPKVGILKQLITVPNLWGTDLTTSSIILADEVKPIEKPPTAEQIAEQPYTLGNSLVTPAASTKLSKTGGGLNVLFLIYNTGQDGDRKPDIAVEYLFYQRFADKPEKYFNKTNPQTFNAATLPPQFDIAAGHNLLANQNVPLASFPEGEYRLEIKITDKLSGKIVTRNVMFSVAA